MSVLDSWNAPKPRVLVAEATEETRASLFDLFDDNGWEVAVANDGRDALVKALTSPPSLLIADIQLGFINGLELCQLLRGDHATRDLPIIVITTPTGGDLFAAATQAGANFVLEKPLSMSVLLKHATDLTRAGRWRFWRPRRRRPRMSR